LTLTDCSDFGRGKSGRLSIAINISTQILMFGSTTEPARLAGSVVGYRFIATAIRLYIGILITLLT